ncbi:hypothetical protein E0Z06_09920 [Rheinheimera sp. D18]|uniref:hypothetical protein n=1 Tax=Rheinheimera sp. D18 TaxID=2545632 RepID=UPI001052251D|nr:hypothetical protein [Rheinheimera sp. D18]QBL09813.1 hypothetical protein E0Z06_09920 [Rheinheimera sp. D18]
MNKETQFKTSTGFTWFLIASLLVSLYFPSSIGGSIIEQLSLLGNSLALFLLLLGVFFCKVPLGSERVVLGLIFIIAISLLSFLSPFSEVTLGAVVPYVTLFIIVSVSYKNVYLSRRQLLFLFLFAIFQLIVAFMIVFSVSWVKAVFESFYQMVPDLYYYMIGWENKPVITYATHSVAGFVFFVFSLVFLVLYYEVKGSFSRFAFLLISILYSSLLVFIFSNTGLFLFVGMLFFYFYFSMKKSGVVFRFFLSFFVVSCFIYVFINYSDIISLAYEKILEVLTSEHNGILARLSMNSRLAGSYTYVFDNPLQGVGFTYNANIAFGDNFISEYVLRGGFASYFIYLVLVLFFCFSNVSSKMMASMLFAFILISDFGYPLLVAYRFVFFFPIMIIIMNYIYREFHDKEHLRTHTR